MGGFFVRWSKVWNRRLQSILAISLLSTYVLSFLFEGQILYGLLDMNGIPASGYSRLAMVAHLLGLFTSGFFIHSTLQARFVMVFGLSVALLSLVPFLFSPSLLWQTGLFVGGYTSGAAITAWGYFLRSFSEKRERFKTCADVLIVSNILMILINVISTQLTPIAGIILVMLALMIGMVLTMRFKESPGSQEYELYQSKVTSDLFKAVLLLSLFIAVFTINSGLMYVVINPAFQHSTALVGWYWAVPYLIALVVMRNQNLTFKYSRMLYLGMAMMIGAFIAFMLLGRSSLDYLVVDTLLLGACGIFDLFWWSILGDMLDYAENPSLVFGVGLSANVLGVLSGGLIGTVAQSTQILTAEITVMGLTIVCITLGMLPVLNRHLVVLLKSHQYLMAYDAMDQNQQSAVLYQAAALEPLTSREREVLEEILLGKSNREIATSLYITENTVKSHAKKIYSKYVVHSRAELISFLLKENDR